MRRRTASEWPCVHQRVFDVTVADQVNEAIDRIEADIGAIDILVNNAGRQAPCAVGGVSG